MNPAEGAEKPRSKSIASAASIRDLNLDVIETSNRLGTLGTLTPPHYDIELNGRIYRVRKIEGKYDISKVVETDTGISMVGGVPKKTVEEILKEYNKMQRSKK